MTARLGVFLVLIFSGGILKASVDPCDFEAPPETRRGVLRLDDLTEEERKDPTILECRRQGRVQIENRRIKIKKEVVQLPKGMRAGDPVLLVRNCEYVKVPKKTGTDWEFKSDVQKLRIRSCRNQEVCSGQAKCLMAETSMLRDEIYKAKGQVEETEVLGIKKFTPEMLGYSKLKPIYRKVVCEALKNGKCPDAEACRADLKVRTAPVSVDGEIGILSASGSAEAKDGAPPGKP